VDDFEPVWQRIQQLAGETFYQLGGATFTYEVHPGSLQPSTSGKPIPRSDFQRVYAQGEIPNQRDLKRMGFEQPSYVFSILTDPRLRSG
jgi:hypothetical protein